jgi:hypothetical protein
MGVLLAVRVLFLEMTKAETDVLRDFFDKGGVVTVVKPHSAKGHDLLAKWSNQRATDEVRQLQHTRNVKERSTRNRRPSKKKR